MFTNLNGITVYVYSLEVEKKIINHKYLHNVLNNNNMVQLTTEHNDFHLIQSFNKGDYQSVNNSYIHKCGGYHKLL